MQHGYILIGALFIPASLVNANVQVCNRMNYPLYVSSVPPAACANNGPQAIQNQQIASCTCFSFDLGPTGPAPGCGTSVKVSRNPDFHQGILQFEYSYQYENGSGFPQSTFDLSDVDGAGQGVAGNPFQDARVELRPQGSGAETCQVQLLQCPPVVTCNDAYLFDTDDTKNKACWVSPEHWLLEISDPVGGCNGSSVQNSPPPPPPQPTPAPAPPSPQPSPPPPTPASAPHTPPGTHLEEVDQDYVLTEVYDIV